MKADVHSRPVVASLYSQTSSAPKPSRPGGVGAASGSSGSQQQQQQQQPHRSHPFSSISLSPDSTRAVASGKDVLHVLRLNLDKSINGGGGRGSIDRSVNRLEEIRSVRIAQHFQTPLQTPTSTAAAGAQSQQYPHLRDALRLPGAARAGSPSLPTPSAGGGGGININVMDVAWSLPQSYVIDTGVGSLDSVSSSGTRPIRVVDGVAGPASHRGSDHRGSDHFGDSYEELLSSPDVHEPEQHSSHDQHYPPFVKRVYVGGGEQRQIFPTTNPIVDDTSVIAAAGSNGVVVAWQATSLLSSLPSSNNSGGGGPTGLFHARKNNVRGSQVSSAASIGQPEAAFLAHSRAVNRLAWHPTGRRPYLLLTASQDGTVKLWDRRATSSSSVLPAVPGRVGFNAPGAQSTINLSAKSWFGFGGSPTVRNSQLPPSNAMARTANWHCVSTYQPKCEAVRDVKWNPFIDDMFGMVAGEWLCIYDIRVPSKPMVKESTHAGDCTSVDWHPTRKYTIATGGGRDRSVKVWDLENDLNIHRQDDSSCHSNLKTNSGSFDETMSATSHTSSEGPVTSPLSESGLRNANHPSLGLQANLSTGSNGSISPLKRSSSGHLLGLAHSRHKKKQPIHVLNIGAPVTRIRWRPPEEASDPQNNHNDSMIAVATSSIYGANAGGNGSVGLWSYHRPYMPISVCEGHSDGAVSEFAWADLPNPSCNYSVEKQKSDHLTNRGTIDPGSNTLVKRASFSHISAESSSIRNRKLKHSRQKAMETNVVPSILRKHDEEGEDQMAPRREWQTILTVGRDGQCLLQSFSYGERPILEVPRATFALANLSPFQPGFGSLQIMAVHQNVVAPEILKERENSVPTNTSRSELVFSITDHGDVEDLSKASLPARVDVAPELTHFSRFSELYITSTGSQFAKKSDVCRHNATVAEGFNQKPLTQMWNTLATILDGSGLNGLPVNASESHSNPMSFALTPTIRNLLLQRADAGDVQTCVVLCEVMDIIIPPSAAGNSAKSRIPNLAIVTVREWYLTYIDLLQQMCLFTQAASLIRNCHDPVVGALNQQSTTIHESCPRCGKPLLGGTTIQDNSGTSPQLSAQRVCRSCRNRVGMCFLCHEPVKGIFVWCPGCGHGGHLDHALEWFGMNEFCPTGCGHKCNLFPMSSNSQKS